MRGCRQRLSAFEHDDMLDDSERSVDLLFKCTTET